MGTDSTLVGAAFRYGASKAKAERDLAAHRFMTNEQRRAGISPVPNFKSNNPGTNVI